MKYISMFFVIFGLLLTSFVVLEAQEEELSSPSQQFQTQYGDTTCDYIRDQLIHLDAEVAKINRSHQRVMDSHEAQISQDYREGKINNYNLKRGILIMLKEMYEGRRKQGCI